jgi:hypothetical protein
MSVFKIDFFELAFLAEACIPPKPIARTMFWQNLTSVYWAQMTEGERAHLFDWLNKNDWYKESLEKEEDTQIFQARFDPDNQYIIETYYDKVHELVRAFKFEDKYYVDTNKSILEEYIVSVEKFTQKKEY